MNAKRILCTGKIATGPIDWHISPLPQTDTNMLVSRYMNRNGFMDMQSNYHLDGFHAAIEGQPLAAMPTEYHEVGWWHGAMGQAEIDRDKYNGSIEDDADFIRHGGA